MAEREETPAAQGPAAASDQRGAEGPAAASTPSGAPASAAAAPKSSQASNRRRQVKVGRVVSDKMNKTVVVAVENTATHRLYHRYLKTTSKFAAHDEDNHCQVGDLVAIVSSRPLSRTKRWRVREILKRAE